MKRARRLPQRGREALLTAVNTRIYFGCREKQQEQGDTRKRSFGIECLMCLMEKKFQKKYVAVARFWKKRGNRDEEFRRAGKWLRWRSLGFFAGKEIKKMKVK